MNWIDKDGKRSWQSDVRVSRRFKLWTDGIVKQTLQTVLLDAVDLLQSRKFPHALVGGLAASIRGRTRVTEDVDFVVTCAVEEAIKLAQSLEGTAFAPLFPEFEPVIRRSFILPLRHRDSGVPVDLAIGVSGLEQQVVSRATHVTIGDRQFAVATAEDLLIMKVLAGRPQDDQDVKGIVKLGGDSLDWDYCLRVAEQLEQAVGIDLVARVHKFKDDA